MLLGSLVLVIAGIVLLANAGAVRDRERAGRVGLSDPNIFKTGIIICLASGVLSPSLNFSFVFGKALQDAATTFGAPSRSVSAKPRPRVGCSLCR